VSKEKRDRQRMKGLYFARLFDDFDPKIKLILLVSERAFWKRLEEAISEKKFRVWGALEMFLQQYNTVLEQRLKSTEETVSLQQQVHQNH
jgi:hypothetical protein